MAIERIICKGGTFSNFKFKVGAAVSYFLDFFRKKSYKDYPIVIINFNRYSYLKRQIDWLESAGMKNIYIIDNKSTYPPLLDYYKKIPHRVYLLDQNIGHSCLWKTGIYRKFVNTPFVLTDSDIVPIESCPHDAVELFYKLLNEFPEVDKVGFSLKIDDVPDHYALKETVVKWEQKFWEDEIRPGIYRATIDTTFALYRRNNKCYGNSSGIRTGGDYSARHMPWYEDSNNFDKETQFYVESANASSSWYKMLKGEKPWWEQQ